MKRLLPTVLLSLIASPLWARSGNVAPVVIEKAGFDTNLVFQIHDNGYLRSTATNYGYFGSINNRLRDSLGHVVPVLECPPNSGVEYLYEAGLWIGGVVAGDTLVSTGSLQFGQGAQHEFYANGYEPGVFTESHGDDEWTFGYADTLIDPETVREDAFDGVHRPLPVGVVQKTYTFDAPGFNNAVFIELTVTNLSDRPIDGLCVGWMMDPDIGDRESLATAVDDITGHTRQAVESAYGTVDVSFAWAMDNDGDPDSRRQFGGMSPARILGCMYLGRVPGVTAAATESYNWWSSSSVSRFDWGPQKQPGIRNRNGGYGTPFGDNDRYRLLSNTEIDYPQVFAAIDRSSEGWVRPPVNDASCDSMSCDSTICDPAVCFATARAIANGSDTRFLHSVGSSTLPPRKSVVLNWVWCVAENPLARPDHFSRTFDPDAPKAYLDGLGLETMAMQMAKLKLGWETRFTDVPIAAPRKFEINTWDDTSCLITWIPKSTPRVRGYQVIRSTAPRTNEPEKTFRIDPLVGTLRDTGLDGLQRYSYSIACIGSDNQVGGIAGTPSPQINLLPDRPHRPLSPRLNSSNDRIIVRPATRDLNVKRYRVERSSDEGIWVEIGSFGLAQPFSDFGITPATPYHYRLTAISYAGTESEPGGSSVAAAFSFDGPLKIFDFTPDSPSSLTDKDSVAAVWSRLAVGATYFDASDSVVTLVDFDSTAGVIVVAEGRAPLPEYVHEFLDLYSKASGPTIISGRDLFNQALSSEITVTLDSTMIGFKAGIRHAFYPSPLLANPTRMNAEFVGALPNSEEFPTLVADSTRTAWGLNPLLPHPGAAVPLVGYFDADTSAAEVLYTYLAADVQSASQGRPVAVMSKESDRTLAIFAFPLSYMREEAASECFNALLNRMAAQTSVAADNATTDFEKVIGYLYRDGAALSNDSDLNRDGVIDIRDVVEMVARGRRSVRDGN